MRVVLILIALMAVAAPLVAPPAVRAQVDLSEHMSIALPGDGAAPVGVVLMFPGCGGVQPLQAVYAQTATQAGWAAVTVDSHGARGIGRLGARALVCTGLRMRGGERADDVFAALEQVRADPRFDAGQVALIGWSHGGWTILDAMARAAGREGASLAGVRAAVLLYPYCGVLTQADTAPIGAEIPVSMTLAGRDRVVSAQACRDLAAARRAEGATLTVIEEPGLTHAFDAEDQPPDPRMRYDADGAARAHTRFAAVLAGVSD
jgi:dienelactone hydrolase